MRRGVLLIVGFFALDAVGVGVYLATRLSPTGAPSRAEDYWPASIDLPRIATIGDLPPADGAAVLAVDAQGALTVNGKATRAEDVLAALRPLADARRAGPGRPLGRTLSDLDVVLALDSKTPWRSVMPLIQSAANVGAPRIFFAVRDPDDGVPGALASFLPQDRHPAWETGRKEPIEIHVTTSTADGCPDPLSLVGAVRADIAAGNEVQVCIDADGDTPLSLVLGVVGAAARAHVGVAFTWITHDDVASEKVGGRDPPVWTLRASRWELPSDSDSDPPPPVHVVPLVLVAPSEPLPRLLRVRGGETPTPK